MNKPQNAQKKRGERGLRTSTGVEGEKEKGRAVEMRKGKGLGGLDVPSRAKERRLQQVSVVIATKTPKQGGGDGCDSARPCTCAKKKVPVVHPCTVHDTATSENACNGTGEKEKKRRKEAKGSGQVLKHD